MEKTTVFYDGLCVACSTEIDHYRKREGAWNLEFVDITRPEFNAAEHGLDPFEVHKVMHVKSRDGHLRTGVDAFRAIWDELPAYRKFTRWSRLAPIDLLLRIGYQAFATARPYLPRRKRDDCAASPYCQVSR